LKRLTLLTLCALSCFLAACGSGSTSSPANKASVSAVTSDQLVYRKITNFTVTGQNLDLGININNLACLRITEVAGGTATRRVFSCKIVGVGTFPMNVTAGDGSTLNTTNFTIPLTNQPQVTMVTSLGTIVMELNPAKAPVSVDNFLNYVESSFYVNTIFHRVESNFVIQGGGFTSSLTQPATMPAIKLEAGNGLSNLRGTVAMARTNVLDSATSQFFVNVVDNAALDTSSGGYAVFGKVVQGLDVVDRIRAVPVSTQGGLTNVPVTPITINSVVQSQ
jgi:cyclophilin family peptidyl-prolyl cis-trans isomerase